MNLLNKLKMMFVRASAFALVLIMSGCMSNIQDEIDPNKDTTPPWIDVKTYIIETTVGKSVDLNGPTAYDAKDGMCDVEVKGYIDWNKAGEYFIVYEASDTSGNTQQVPITVVVKEAAVATVDPEDETISEKEECAGEVKDATKDCNSVLNSDIDKYFKIYDNGEKGLINCEKDKLEDEICEAIYTNDGSLWGYGIRKSEE